MRLFIAGLGTLVVLVTAFAIAVYDYARHGVAAPVTALRPEVKPAAEVPSLVPGTADRLAPAVPPAAPAPPPVAAPLPPRLVQAEQVAPAEPAAPAAPVVQPRKEPPVLGPKPQDPRKEEEEGED